MTMTGESDAIALWDDVIDLITENEGTSAQIIAMARRCVPVGFDGTTITVETPARFMRTQLEKKTPLIEQYLEQAAFSPVKLDIRLAEQRSRQPINTTSVMSAADIAAMPAEVTSSTGRVARPRENFETPHPVAQTHQIQETTTVVDSWRPSSTPEVKVSIEERRRSNPLVSDITENDSKLTFDRFIEGSENMLALQAAKQVADGDHNYNPLFIYGRSGLGKTHLLKAIQNYILQNNIEKICVYRVAHDFVNEYASAMVNTTVEVKQAFTRHYHDVDVLIIDDIQFLKGAASVGFFFDLFNYLKEHGKQIVLAADESPVQLGIGNSDFDERMISRFNSGFACPIQAPEYELKLALVRNFYTRAKEDAQSEHISGYEGIISDEMLQLMAARSGPNIRVIESFCQTCLLEATKNEKGGSDFGREDVIRIANQKFGTAHRTVTIDQIQRAIEEEFHVSHGDLVGDTRRKEIMIARHAACWLARSLTDLTLADIGKRFGGRSHATVYHSVSEAGELMESDRQFFDRITRLKDILLNE
ncbi:chromosomal replication initiator protein DnaA [Olsenella sp. Marseille-QA0557]|uniref:chromosomal replication initiator protein DnaA n=1 Tax=Olsenella sp. Marseille-QA0557 TaxID=3378782 RepID=UPI003D0B34E2